MEKIMNLSQPIWNNFVVHTEKKLAKEQNMNLTRPNCNEILVPEDTNLNKKEQNLSDHGTNHEFDLA
jgi:hypothetical protein